LRERYGLWASHKRLAKLPRKYGLNACGLTVCKNLLSRDFHAAGTLETAVGNRKPRAGLLFHSDRGAQYCPALFWETLKRWRPQARLSVSRKRNCRDNARAESFFKTLKRELETLDGRQNAAAVRVSVFQYIGA
jgi:transposase InsO family protein